MITRFAHISLFLIVFCSFAVFSEAQQRNADNSSSVISDGKDSDKDSQPKNVGEMLAKMRIEKEKKDFTAMLNRGEEAVKLSQQIETNLETTPQLTNKDLAKLESLEKLVKKIRNDLGGSDENESDESDEVSPKTAQSQVEKPSSIIEGFRALKNTTVKLVDELKKTTRFSISAAAIQSTNAVLRLARILRFRH